jgi:hypothetical protein
MLFHKGNWEKESALAIGAHFHTYWQPNKVVWQADTAMVCIDPDSNNECDLVKRNYGGYFPIGSTVKGSTDFWDDKQLEVDETEDLDFMLELFSAYTFSKARKGMRGRVSSTVGGSVQIPTNSDIYPYRIFISADVDITRKLKMILEVFYDSFYLDLNQRTDDEYEGPFASHYAYKISADDTTPVTEADFNNIRPIHFDFGFMYAVNEHFRFGIHNQTPIIAFYWKF